MFIIIVLYYITEVLPSPTEEFDSENNTKIVTEHIIRDGKKIKVLYK